MTWEVIMLVREAICICRSARGCEVSEVVSAWIFYDEKTGRTEISGKKVF